MKYDSLNIWKWENLGKFMGQIFSTYGANKVMFDVWIHRHGSRTINMADTGTSCFKYSAAALPNLEAKLKLLPTFIHDQKS